MLAAYHPSGTPLPRVATLGFPGTQIIPTQMRHYRRLRGGRSYRHGSKVTSGLSRIGQLTCTPVAWTAMGSFHGQELRVSARAVHSPLRGG